MSSEDEMDGVEAPVGAFPVVYMSNKRGGGGSSSKRSSNTTSTSSTDPDGPSAAKSHVDDGDTFDELPWQTADVGASVGGEGFFGLEVLDAGSYDVVKHSSGASFLSVKNQKSKSKSKSKDGSGKKAKSKKGNKARPESEAMEVDGDGDGDGESSGKGTTESKAAEEAATKVDTENGQEQKKEGGRTRRHKKEKKDKRKAGEDPTKPDGQQSNTEQGKQKKEYLCKLCDADLGSLASLRMHVKGKKHLRRVEEAQSRGEELPALSLEDPKAPGKPQAKSAGHKEGKKASQPHKLVRPDAHQVGTKSDGDDSDSSEGDDFDPWSVYNLHSVLRDRIRALHFAAPTPIQAATLLPSVRDYKDVVGAAETGSGKTLAYGLPMVHRILERRKALGMPITQEDVGDVAMPRGFAKLPALVICPTRELAMQVRDHLVALTTGTFVKSVAIVGGLAEVKQERMLRAHPDIVIATPGRLWELIDSGNEFLNDLKHLQFLVLDEADRLVEKGHFPRLNNLLHMLQSKEDTKDNAAPPTGASSGKPERSDAWVTAPRHYKRQTFLFSATLGVATSETAKEAAAALIAAQEQALEKEREVAIELARASKGKVMPPRKLGKKAKRRQLEAAKRMTPIELLMLRVGVTNDSHQVRIERGVSGEGAVAVVGIEALRGGRRVSGGGGGGGGGEEDSTSASKSTTSIELPPGLVLARFSCPEGVKDPYLYYFLLHHPGRTLIFVNTISAVRRVTSMLTALNIHVNSLFGNMQQRQRLKNLERFRDSDDAVMVATDVAARGLDIPNVKHVLHYQMPKLASFVHRSGRTARAFTEGLSVMFIGPEDEKLYASVMMQIGHPEGAPEFPVPISVMKKVTSRVSIARKIAELTTSAERAQASRNWLTRMAKEADLALDDHMLREAGLEEDDDEGLGKQGTKAYREAAKTAAELKRLRAQLRDMLKVRLIPKGVSSKFLTQSSAGLLGGVESMSKLLAPPAQREAGSASKSKTKRRHGDISSAEPSSTVARVGETLASVSARDGVLRPTDALAAVKSQTSKRGTGSGPADSESAHKSKSLLDMFSPGKTVSKAKRRRRD